MSRRSTPPKYARHSSGQARVRIDGRVVYLGEYGSRESREMYALIIVDWLDEREDDGSLPDLTVEQLSLAYLAFAKDYYVKNGETTDHVYTIRAALKILVQYHRGEPARGFSPKRLKRLQEVLTSRGLSRRYLNDLTGVIKRCFKWAASEELIPVTVYDGLRTVDGVRMGRSEARETDRVKPVNDDNVRAVLPFVSMQIKAMIQLQRLTGMRPGEVLIMRPCDVSMVADGSEPIAHGHTRRSTTDTTASSASDSKHSKSSVPGWIGRAMRIAFNRQNLTVERTASLIAPSRIVATAIHWRFAGHVIALVLMSGLQINSVMNMRHSFASSSDWRRHR